MKNQENRVVRAVAQRLEGLQRAGVTHVRRVPLAPISAARPPAVPAGTGCPRAAVEGRREPAEMDERAAALAAVARQVAACTRCAELVRTRTQTVFGVGNPYARLVFIGEAPGVDEDRQGEPFVGVAGQLLNKIIEACGLRRQDVYIMNILRCRPLGNRAPLPVEAAACREYLDRQLAIIQPEFICCLGAVAAQNLLQTDTSIGRLRGRFHDYHGIKVLCTYHPAYLLRNPAAKRPTWDDMQLLMAEMGIKPPPKE
jgi:DNA polymerase